MTCNICGNELDIWERRSGTGKVCDACKGQPVAPMDWDAILARVETHMSSWRMFGAEARELP